MIDALRLAGGWALVWLFGWLAVAAILRRGLRQRPGQSWAWTVGCGFFAGAFIVTVWMRALSFVGMRFSIASIALPLVIVSIALAVLVRRRAVAEQRSEAASADDVAPLSGGKRALLYVLVGWLALRFVALLLDVVWTPLYPWDAWIQWATKARVWYSLGQIVPFGRSDAWFAANGALWFDASPNYPATVPLWQVWSSIALGRWDDALMNLPWWLVAVALAIAIYGALRESGLGPLGATIGAWLASSLPLANVHVALAGYADLPMAAYYALAALALWRWSRERRLASASLALLFAVACTTIKTPGLVWALTLLPGAVLALMPQRGPRVVAIGIAIVLSTLAVLAQTDPVVLGYRLHLDFAPAWAALADSLFLLGNWHLLWYAVIAAALVGWQVLRAPALAPLSITVASGLLFLIVAFAFTNARNWVTDQTTINRAVLHVAPLALVWTILVVDAWLHQRIRTGSARVVAPAAVTAA
jgi:hypothetical protein